MPSFSPYTAVTDDDQKLVLEISSGRKIFYFIYFRIFPFLILLMMAAIIALIGMEKKLTSMLVVMTASLLLVFVLLVFHRYISRIEITKDKFIIHKNIFLRGTVAEEILCSDIEMLSSNFEASSWGKGEVFIVKKDGTRYSIINFPALNINRDKLLQVGHALAKRAGLKFGPKL